MLVTLKNDFHGTAATVLPGKLSPAQVKRIWKELCGMQDCTCSGGLGTRGPQEVEIIQDYDSFTGADTFTVRPKTETKNVWVLTSPDSGNYFPEFAQEEIQAQADRFDLTVTATGETRDAGFGQEEEFEVTGDPEDIQRFEDALADILV